MENLLKKATPKPIKRLYKQFKNRKYSGDNVECPVCGTTFAKFAPFGSDQRENAKCPMCGSLERHRLLWKYLCNKENILGRGNIRVLHFGPEKMFYDIFSEMRNIEYVPCDLFPEVYNYNGRVKIQKVDITDIPYQAEYFDVILCIHVLEHIPDDRKAMSELFRVMKKDGFGIFQVPIDYNRKETYEDFSIIDPKEREKAFGQSDHVRWYGHDYKDRLSSAGFRVKEDNYIEEFKKEQQYRFGFMDGERIYSCRK